MTKLLNSAGTQYYANKMCNADNRKVGNKSLTTALTDIDNLIDEMKVHFDKEYGSSLSMDISNNTNSFSIGAGINIDKKNEVENSFTAIGISGNSLVNIADKENFTLVSHKSVTIPILHNLKADTSYTIMIKTAKNTLNRIKLRFLLSDNTAWYNSLFVRDSRNGFHASVFRNNLEVQSFAIYNDTNEANDGCSCEISDIVVLEGNWTNKLLPQYFKGLKSVGEKDNGENKINISSIGKNIILDSELKNQNREWDRFQGEIVPGYLDNAGHTIKFKGNGGYYDVLSQRIYDCNSNHNKILPNTWYTLSFYAKGNTMRSHIYPSLIDSNITGFVDNKEMMLANDGHLDWKLTNEWARHTYTFKTNSPIPYNPVAENKVLFRAMPDSDCVVSCIMLEQGKVATEYEPQPIDKKEVTLDEPLRGLPNGIKDTIEKVNGEWKIVRRCGELTINPADIKRDGNGVTGDFRWIMANNSDIANLTQTSIVHVLCNKYPSTTSGSTWESAAEGMAQNNNGNRILLFLNKYKEGSEENKTNLKKEIGNDTKVIYQLTTPVIEDIDPITLQCWKNGTILIDETLPVESTHEIALNKAAQIKNNMEELVSLKKKVQNLEKQYDQIALEQAHQLSLLKHSYEVDYDI